MARDALVHGRKTIIGIDLSFGTTTTTPCGKKRPRERTSVSPSVVTCPACREWAMREEHQMADGARAALRLLADGVVISDKISTDDLISEVETHSQRAAEWT